MSKNVENVECASNVIPLWDKETSIEIYDIKIRLVTDHKVAIIIGIPFTDINQCAPVLGHNLHERTISTCAIYNMYPKNGMLKAMEHHVLNIIDAYRKMYESLGIKIIKIDYFAVKKDEPVNP